MGEFGDKFRKEREKKGISLEDVSNATKISSRMLLAIENEQFDRLPGGVFNKGFIRAYAKHIGLNEDQAVEDYTACLHQSQYDSQEVWDPQGSSRADSHEGEELPELQLPRAEHVGSPRETYGLRRERSISWRILFLTVVVIVLATLLWKRHSHGTPTQAAVPPAASTAQPGSQPAPPTAAIASAPVSSLRSTSAPASVRPSTLKTAGAATPASADRSATPALIKPAPSSGPNSGNDANTNLATQPNQPVNSKASAESAGPLSLVIRASENSWISVTADGRSVLHELLIAPAHATIQASREITVRAGNAAGVTFVWNGRELPAQGAEGEVKTLVFDDTGMHELPTGPAPQNP